MIKVWVFVVTSYTTRLSSDDTLFPIYIAFIGHSCANIEPYASVVLKQHSGSISQCSGIQRVVLLCISFSSYDSLMTVESCSIKSKAASAAASHSFHNMSSRCKT